MADKSKTFTAEDNKPSWTDLNNLKDDIQTAGQDRNLGGYRITNCAGMLDPGGFPLAGMRVFPVTNYGAVGDGVTDDTDAFVDAIAAAAAVHGIVYVPPTADGYLIATNNTITVQDCTLMGDFRVQGKWPYAGTPYGRGSTLLFTDDPGVTTGWSIRMGYNSAIVGLAFYYPDQVATNPPTAYPPTIRVNDGVQDALVEHCAPINCYTFIDSSYQGGGGRSRMVVRHIRGLALYRMIVVDNGNDHDRIEDIKVANLWLADTYPWGGANYLTWMASNAVAVEVLRSDSIWIDGVRGGGYMELIRLGKSVQGGSYGSISRCSADGNVIGIHVLEDGIGGNGYTINDCEIIPGSNPYVGSNGQEGIVVDDGTYTSTPFLNISNTRFWIGTAASVGYLIKVAQTKLRLCNVSMNDWAESPYTAIYMDKAGELLMNNCTLVAAKPQITVAATYTGSKPQISNCMFGGALAVTDGPSIGYSAINSVDANGMLHKLNGNLELLNTAANGANFKMTGDGGTTPKKWIRVSGGQLQIMSDAYGVIMALLDGGALFLTGLPSASPGSKGLYYDAADGNRVKFTP